MVSVVEGCAVGCVSDTGDRGDSAISANCGFRQYDMITCLAGWQVWAVYIVGKLKSFLIRLLLDKIMACSA